MGCRKEFLGARSNRFWWHSCSAGGDRIGLGSGLKKLLALLQLGLRLRLLLRDPKVDLVVMLLCISDKPSVSR